MRLDEQIGAHQSSSFTLRRLPAAIHLQADNRVTEITMHISTLPRVSLYLIDSNDHLDCGPGPTNFAGEITVEAWVCLYSKGGVVVSHRGSVNDGYVMSVSTSGLRIELANGAEKVRLDTPSAPFDDQWHHLAFTLKDKVISAYIDGIPQGTAAFHSPIRLHAQALRFGRDAYSPKPDRGLGCIAEVRIWNKARTAGQIADAMHYRLDTAAASETAGLLGYWPLAGSPQDVSGQGHHGLKQGGKWTDDSLLPLFKRGEPLAISGFQGAHYAECATTANRFDALTVEAWVQAPGDCDGGVIQWAGPQDTPKFSLAVSKRDLVATLALNAQNQTVATIPSALVAGRWHHVAFTWSQAAQCITMYIDGVAKGTQPSTATALDFTQSAIRLNPGRLHVADVRIWNTARPPNELLATRHTRLLGNEPNLVAYWRLDRPGRTIQDQTGKLPAAIFVGQGVDWTVAPDLPLEEARVANAVLSFNDRDDHVGCILNTPTMTNALTVEAWVCIQNMSGTVVAQGTISPGVTSYDMSVSHNTLSVEVRGRVQTQLVTVSAPVASLVGSWHHVAFTLFDNIITTYIDGVANERKLVIDVAHENLGSDLYIGCHSQLRNTFKGEIAEVRVWNLCRSAQQINAARLRRLSGGEAGLVAYFPLAEGTGHSTTDRVNAIPAALQGPTWKSDPSLPLAPAADRGHALLPAATAATASTPPPATKNAWLEFDGIDDYLDCGEIDFTRGAYTIEAWIKTPQYGTLMAATVNAEHGLIFATGRYLHRYPPGTVGGAAINLSDEQIKQITDDQWHHIAVVRTESALVMVIDGVRETTLNGHSPVFQEAPRVLVGRRAPNVLQNTFKGGIRNLRIWNIARSDQDIASAMHQRSFGTEPGLVAYWPLDEGAGIQGAASNTLVDRTGRYTATINGARWVSDGALANATPVLQPPALVQADDAPARADVVLSLTKGQVFSSSSELATENLDPSLKKLIDEVEQAKEGDSLSLTAESFSEFNLFTSLNGFLVNTLGIRDFKLTLLGVAQRESGEGAEPAPTHAAVPAHDAAQAHPTPDKHISGEVGLNITGKVDLLGLSAVDITVEFVIRDDKSKATFVKIDGGDVLKDAKALLAGALPAEVASVLDILGALTISNPTIAFATEDFDDIVPPYNLGVRPGLNLYGTLKTDQFADPSARTFGKVLKFVADLFGLDALTVRVVLHKSSAGMELGLDTVIEQDIALLKGESFSLIYKGLAVNLSVRGTPPEPSLSIINQLVLTLTYIGAEDLLLTGSFKGEAESFTGAYTLQAPEDKPWHPFNFSQLSVGALAFQVGGTYTMPFIDNFDVAAQNITIGKGADAVKGSLAILIDFNDPDQFVLVIETPGITLLQLLSCFSLPTLIAYQALPSGITTALNTIVNVKLKGPREGENAKVSIVPAPTHIGGLAYDEEGIHAQGTLSLWGWEATTGIHISPETVEILAELHPIDISIGGVDIFSVRGAEDNEKPAFRLYLGSEETPEFFMALSVNLLMMRSAVYARLDERGLKFTLERSFGPIQTWLSVMADSTGVEARGSTTFSLNLSIPFPGIGSIQLVDVKFVAATMLKVAQSFTLKLDGDFEFYSRSYSLSLTLNEPVADFSDLLEKVIAQLLKMVGEGLFAAIWNTFEAWGQAVVDGVIYGYDSVASVAKNVYKLGGDQMQRIIRVSQEIGDGVVTIASGMNLVYQWSETQAAQAFKVAGYAADEVINALTISYQIPAATIKVALDAAGYAAEEIFAGLCTALVSVNSLAADGFAGALKAAGYAVEKIAEGLKAGYGLAEKAMISTLKAVGYVAGEVARGLKAAYALGERAMIDTLKTAWYGVEEVAQGLKAAYTLGADGVAGLLKGAGYTVAAVAIGLKSAYALTADQIVPVLLHARYILKDVGTALKDGYKLTEDLAVKALELASNSVDLVTGIAKSAPTIVSGQAILISNLATSAVVPITSVLKDVYLCAGDSAARILKAAKMYSVSGVAQGLKEVYHFTGDAAANALKGAEYVALETTGALKAVYQFTAVQTAQALKGAGYLVGEVARGLNDVLFLGDIAASVPLASALKGAGYAVSEVAQGLKDAYSLSGDAAAVTLKGAGYTARQVAQGLKDTYQLTGEATAVALKGAGYAAKEVGDALHITYQFTLDQAKNALNGAGYAASAIVNVLF